MIHVSAPETSAPLPEYSPANPLRIFIDTNDVGDLLVRYDYGRQQIRLPICTENNPCGAGISVALFVYGLLSFKGIYENSVRIIVDGACYRQNDLSDAVEAAVTVAKACHRLKKMREHYNLKTS